MAAQDKQTAQPNMFRRFTSHLPLVANRVPSLSMFKDPTQFKYLLLWFKSRQKDYLLDHALPWLTFDAINFLKKNVKEGSHVFEYGSGSSTLFWANYKAHCVSIEHDADWYALLKKRFKPGDDIDLRLVPPDPQPDPTNAIDSDDPRSYRSHAVGFTEATFRNYVSQIDSFPDSYFDIVMIDGRARLSCLLHSVHKVKPGGMLIMDNLDVPRYLALGSHYLEGFTPHRFFGIGPINGVMTQTNIYIAP